jgi:UDP-N-acetyl-D-mannosaminuronic acid dehydrogenase
LGAIVKFDIVVIGGGGHVGLPLSIMFASKGIKVAIYDISQTAVEKINAAEMPFWEPGAKELLFNAVQDGNLKAFNDPSCISEAQNVIVVIGTPVDEHLNPDPNALRNSLELSRKHFRDGQLLILRSTIFPGVTRQIEEQMHEWGLKIDVAFAPERIAEHNAVEELVSLPQIVSSRTEQGFERARLLFLTLANEVIRLSPEEAELAKLFTNSWRYVKFAMANQFYMMANERGLDYEQIRTAMRHNYPRASDVAGAGFAAGPCLFKDTMQLAAFSDNKFQIGHSAMLINEGLPLYVVSKIEAKHDLKNMTVGILGMSFKAGSDDIRSSLSYKLKRVLSFKAKSVLCTDPMVSENVDSTLLPLDQVIEKSDLLILATPHLEYRTLNVKQPLVDVWGLTGSGVTI